MTISEFNKTRFCCVMFAIYEGIKYQIVAVEFDEALIGLHGVVSGYDGIAIANKQNVITETIMLFFITILK